MMLILTSVGVDKIVTITIATTFIMLWRQHLSNLTLVILWVAVGIDIDIVIFVIVICLAVVHLFLLLHNILFKPPHSNSLTYYLLLWTLTHCNLFVNILRIDWRWRYRRWLLQSRQLSHHIILIYSTTTTYTTTFLSQIIQLIYQQLIFLLQFVYSLFKLNHLLIKDMLGHL